MRLVPAILTDSIDDYRHKLRLVESFTDRAQVDFMDGLFVPSISIRPVDAVAIGTNLSLEAHLMVKDPVLHLEIIKRSSFTKAFFHYEAVSDHRSVINRIRDLKMKVGLAINPNTPVDVFSGLVGEIDSVLFLGVDPIRSSPFQPGVLDKLKRFRLAFPEIDVGIDGGIRFENLNAVIDAGPDFICIGNAIFRAPDPELALKKFQMQIESAGSKGAYHGGERR